MDHYSEELGMNIPGHVAIILDGNGRWAKNRHLPRNMGHVQGSRVLDQITDDAQDIGIQIFTAYVFSTENWKRSELEVKGLMNILRHYLKNCIKKFNEKNRKFRVLGKDDNLDEDILKSIHELEEATKNNTGMICQLALNYGGRDEITRAVRRISSDVKNEVIQIDEISEDLISKYLDTKGDLDADLIIRTSGEQRLSNFLLWQGAYAELDFPEILWPDFNKDRLIEAIERYNHRDRRFGGVKEE